MTAGTSEHLPRRTPRAERGRADAQVRVQVVRALRDAVAFGAATIKAEVADGVVVLTGTVPSERALVAAEDLAIHIAGVTRVVNQLAVRSPAIAGGENVHGDAARGPVPRAALVLYRILLLWVVIAIFVLLSGIAIVVGTTRLTWEAAEIVALAALVIGAVLAVLARSRRA